MLLPLLGLCPTTAWCGAELSPCELSSQSFAASSNMASSMSSSAVKDLWNISMMFLWLGSWTNPNIRFKTTDMLLVKLCKIRFVLAGLKWMCLIHVKKNPKKHAIYLHYMLLISVRMHNVPWSGSWRWVRCLRGLTQTDPLAPRHSFFPGSLAWINT